MTLATIPESDLFAAIALVFGVGIQDIRSRRRGLLYATARAVCCHVLRRSGMTDGQVAKLLFVDRTAVVYYRRTLPESTMLPEIERVEGLIGAQYDAPETHAKASLWRSGRKDGVLGP